MQTIRTLTSHEEIEDACALLHAVYIEKMKWNFLPDNPSRNRVEVRNNQKILTDKFAEDALWFGVFEEDMLIACLRMQHVDENNEFEVEGYESSKVIQQYLPSPKDKCVELAKFAILPEHVTPGIINKLFVTMFRVCEEKGYSVIGFTHNNFLKNFFQRIQFPLVVQHAFKYEPNDPLPVNFYYADHAKLEVANIISLLDYIDKDCSTLRIKIFKALEIAAPVLPIPLYWQNREGVVLGINEHCLNAIGTSKEIIGKTPYEFYPKETAEHILNHHNLVMDRGEVLVQEERINDITTGNKKYFSSIKAPLYDDDGAIIGIVGTSIDITAEKETERLKLENEKLEIENKFQNKLIQEQNNFKKIIDQAVHDIRSPLASLMIISKYTKNIPEDFCAVISGASRRIDDIANNLLETYRPKYNEGQSDRLTTEPRDSFQVLLALYEIISEKKYEFHDLQVEFKISAGSLAYSAFIYAEEISFKRMISNLINNAVEAFENKSGIVNIIINSAETSVEITIEDNGKGMPEHVVHKIMSNISVTEGKREGHGIGFTQVRETLRNSDGYLDIESTLGAGTRIALTLPKVQCPTWIAPNLELNSDDIIVMLDDDTSMHEAWKIRFREQCPDIVVNHFEFGEDAMQFIGKLTPEQKERVLLLADYELIGQDLNGLEVIERSKIKRSVLVTSHYNNREVLNELKKTSIKLLPKLFISEIPINVNQSMPDAITIPIDFDAYAPVV